MLNVIKNWLKSTWKQILATIGITGVLLIGGYFAVVTTVGWIEHTLDSKLEKQKQSFVQRFDDLEQDMNGNIRVLERKLDSTSTAIQAKTEQIPSPNFFQRLFNTETNKLRNAVLDSIPEVIQNELNKIDLEPRSIGEATLSVRGDTVTFSATQDYIAGYWGEIVKQTSNDGELIYQMVLKPVKISLKEIRTQPDPVTGQPRVYLTAIDERTGNEIEISSTNFQFLEEKQTGFRFDPRFNATLGVSILSDKAYPVVKGSLDWLHYQSKSMRLSFLSIESNIYTDNNSIRQFTTLGLIKVKL